MYIPEFWCGVISVLAIEAIVPIAIGFIRSLTGGKKNGQVEETNREN